MGVEDQLLVREKLGWAMGAGGPWEREDRYLGEEARLSPCDVLGGDGR